MKKIIGLSLLLILLIAASTGFAQAKSWELDKAHANIYFGVDHIFTKIRGHFDYFSAKISFDPEDLAASNFFFEIEVDSINTKNGKRDKHLRSADFFNESDYTDFHPFDSLLLPASFDSI